MEFLTSQEIRDLVLQHRGQLPKTADYTAWEEAFEKYNTDPANSHISMGCVPCYRKVFEYTNKTE